MRKQLFNLRQCAAALLAAAGLLALMAVPADGHGALEFLALLIGSKALAALAIWAATRLCRPAGKEED